MPYRMGRGDYYRGDYYRGSIFGAIKSVVGGAAKGFIKGGPIGGIAGAIGGSAGYIKKQTSPGTSIVAPIGSSSFGTPVASGDSPEELIRKHQINVHKAQSSGVMAGKPGATAVIAPHPVTGKPTVVHMGSGRRTMRVTNPKALRRAIRRLDGFKKMALKTIRLIDPTRKAKKFGGWKKGRRR